MVSTQGYVSTESGELFFERKGEPQGEPLVCVHGGPGFTSLYLDPLFDLSNSCEVVCYDQAGCGRARRGGARKLFSLASFVDELEQLRVTLGVETMHLLGHSFGAAIIGEYTLAHPQRVRSAIFASASLDIPRWVEDGQRLVSKLPLMTRMVLREGERTGNVHSAEYQRALSVYYEKHIFGLSPLPAILLESMAQSDPVTYRTVWGANELLVTGLVREYSLSPRLPTLTCPTLFTCGRYDEATPEAHEFFASQVPGGRCVIHEASAHHPHITERELFVATIRDFLASIRV